MSHAEIESEYDFQEEEVECLSDALAIHGIVLQDRGAEPEVVDMCNIAWISGAHAALQLVPSKISLAFAMRELAEAMSELTGIPAPVALAMMLSNLDPGD